MGERLSILLHRLKALLWRRRLDRDIEDELRFHMEMLRKNISRTSFRKRNFIQGGVPRNVDLRFD